MMRTYADGTTKQVEWETGEVRFNEPSKIAYKTKNIGQADVHLYIVELKGHIDFYFALAVDIERVGLARKSEILAVGKENALFTWYGHGLGPVVIGFARR